MRTPAAAAHFDDEGMRPDAFFCGQGDVLTEPLTEKEKKGPVTSPVTYDGGIYTEQDEQVALEIGLGPFTAPFIVDEGQIMDPTLAGDIVIDDSLLNDSQLNALDLHVSFLFFISSTLLCA